MLTVSVVEEAGYKVRKYTTVHVDTGSKVASLVNDKGEIALFSSLSDGEEDYQSMIEFSTLDEFESVFAVESL